MISLIKLLEQKYKECPPSTQDIELNTKNRDATVKDYNYGPLNVDEPGDYWKKVADKWNTTEEAAKTSLCANCTAFDISPRMLECLPGPVSEPIEDEDGKLAYVESSCAICHSRKSDNPICLLSRCNLGIVILVLGIVFYPCEKCQCRSTQ